MTNDSLSTSTVQQHFECLTHHQNAVQKYNIHRNGLYTLPLEAITRFKADLVHIIGSKLKVHFKQSGKQTISFPCLESLFFSIFEGHIHYFNSRKGSYKSEKEANCNLFSKRYKNRLPRLTIEWKMKAKIDAKNNQTSARYMYLSFYTRQI
ncbi:hypothetical protein C2G38_2091399 [Gigaspora rosea]|uniref:Uncharacterized protein n=1 Tax=Gigaspora rosea TaxID=44941 RepID=A0A397V1F8_9GLOM|nr:hypothetical protein C2G38_2091399 [Gigaspora rosea]